MSEYDLWFSLLNLSSRKKIELLGKFNDTKSIWLYYKTSHSTVKLPQKEDICELKKILNKNNIKAVCYTDEDYPEKLKPFDDAPFVLFYKGNISKLNYCFNISIIGARNCTSYGKSVTKILAKAISLNNLSIISGFAKGIDTEAHKTAIENGGYTCAVLGCGLDIIYPKENYKLYNEILENGCIISEFIPGTPPYSHNFPIRNRIISALSDIIIVVEAGEKSGSLITARYALDQGKQVMAVPGSIFSGASKGTNKLIQDGAWPVLEIDSINKDFDIIMNITKNQKDINYKAKSKYESILFNIIKDSPIHIDDIIRISNVDISRVYKVLFEMQLTNQIICLSGNYYVRVINDI